MHRYWAYAVTARGNAVTYGDYANSNYTFQYNFQNMHREDIIVSFVEVKVNDVTNNELVFLFNDRVLSINELLK